MWVATLTLPRGPAFLKTLEQSWCVSQSAVWGLPGVPLGVPGSPLQSTAQLNLSDFDQQKLGQWHYIISELCNNYFR